MMAIRDGFVGGTGTLLDSKPLTGGRIQRTPGLVDYDGSTARVISRRNGNANVVFADGHVEPPTLKLMFFDDGKAALARWNRDHHPHRADF